MKAIKINASLAVKLFSLTLLLTLSTSSQKLAAQLFFSNFEGSQVKISSSNTNVKLVPITSQFSCEGKFTMLNGELSYLSDLKFNLPLAAKDQEFTNTKVLSAPRPINDINFELTHSMVLPELNMIHAIGYLVVQGIKTRVDFHLDYMENNNEMITIMGRRSIKLSDYKKNSISVFSDAKTQDIIQLDLKLVIKNPTKVEYIAALAK